MSSTVATTTAPTATATAVTNTTTATSDAAIMDAQDDATYMMNTFSTLLEGDLFDDELNGRSYIHALGRNCFVKMTDTKPEMALGH